MAPGRAADVSQDSACCRADGEPAGAARPDDFKPMYLYGSEGGGEGRGLSHIQKEWRWEICHFGHTLFHVHCLSSHACTRALKAAASMVGQI